MAVTQLLCTFASADDLDAVLSQIVKNYDIAFNTIYVLENVDVPLTYCCTYNIFDESEVGDNIPVATISLHRKKASNTLYTINALNLLVMGLNGGKMDKRFVLPWEEYKNTIIVTAYGKLKIINTKLAKIVKVSDLTPD
jgi:hypothetical protein